MNFEYPDRAPRDIWTVPAVSLYYKKEYATLLQKYPPDISRPQVCIGASEDEYSACLQIGSYKDAWGSIWHVAEPGVIGEVKQPVLEDLSSLNDYELPWHLIKNRDVDQIDKACDESDLFMLSEVAARPFERLQFLHGTINTFIDLAYGKAQVKKLIKMIHEYFLKDIEVWCRTSVDGVVFIDDWGTMNSLLISPQLWREIFKPLYKDYCALIHSYGKYAFFHSDGYVFEIFNDLMELGIDAINLQLSLMNLEDLANICKGKITLWGEIDRQRVLPFGTRKEVHEAVMAIRHVFDDGKGGVIAQCEWGKDNSADNIEQVYKSWLDPIEDKKV
jgi:hypothetical protein